MSQTPPSPAAPPAARTVTAGILIIGNEILSGRVQDENVAYLARGLNSVGVRLCEVRVIRDERAAIVAAVNETRHRFDYVLTTGGIGPTHDDITASAIADAFGLALHSHPEMVRLLAIGRRPEEMNAARLRMAEMPEGATLLANPVSRAPGFQIGNVFVLPGVPRIMQAIFDAMKHALAGGAPVVSRALSCGLAETVFAAELERVQARFEDVEIGSYPYFRQGEFGVTLIVRGTEPTRVESARDAVAALIRALGGEPREVAVDT